MLTNASLTISSFWVLCVCVCVWVIALVQESNESEILPSKNALGNKANIKVMRERELTISFVKNIKYRNIHGLVVKCWHHTRGEM